MTPALPIVVNVITPCSRPENLPDLRRSLDAALANTSQTILRWWVICDARHVSSLPTVRCHHSEIVEAEGFAGHAQRNQGLDLISYGWVYFLDDDNLIHPGFLRALESAVATEPWMKGMLVAQLTPGGIRPSRSVRKCHIDTAQFALDRSLIGDARFAAHDYCADGGFIEALYSRSPSAFRMTDEPLSYYNRLRVAPDGRAGELACGSNAPTPNVVVYSLTWNEAEIIPWFLAHYRTFADQIVVYDGGSTDGTREIVSAWDGAILRDLDTGCALRDDLHACVKNTGWQGRSAGWVVCADCDEFLFSPAGRMADVLARLEADGIAVPKTTGFNMFSERFPRYSPGQQLLDHITVGAPDGWYSKCALFDTRRVDQMNYAYGCHGCRPSFRGVPVALRDPDPPLFLLHFKFIGGFERVRRRFETTARRLSGFNRTLGLGAGNLEQLPRDYARVRDSACPIPGLAGLCHRGSRPGEEHR